MSFLETLGRFMSFSPNVWGLTIIFLVFCYRCTTLSLSIKINATINEKGAYISFLKH